MKFKLILLSVIFAGASYAADAQTYASYQNEDAEAEAMINLLGVQKREAIAQLVPVTVEDSAASWKLYDEYNNLNKKTAKIRLTLYEKTVHSYANMTPAVADSLALQYFSNRVEQEKMAQDYYKKIKAATNSVVAFEFYQAEAYLLTQIRSQIMQQIPTYGQLINANKK